MIRVETKYIWTKTSNGALLASTGVTSRGLLLHVHRIDLHVHMLTGWRAIEKDTIPYTVQERRRLMPRLFPDYEQTTGKFLVDAAALKGYSLLQELLSEYQPRSWAVRG